MTSFACKGSYAQAMVINEGLDVFCMSSRKKVSKTSTQVFFSHNVKPAEAKNISAYLGFYVTKNLGKYMGMSILHSNVNKLTYQGIANIVEQRLSR